MSASAVQVAGASATAPVVMSEAAPVAVQYMQAAVPQQYAPQGQEVVYVDEAGNPVDVPAAVPQQYAPQGQEVVYVDEAGNPVDVNAMQSVQGGVQYVDEAGNPCDEFGNPLQYVDEQGNPVVYGAPPAAVVASSQPAVFNVSPEIFLKLAQGGTLTQEEMDALTGGPAPAAAATSATAAVVADDASAAKAAETSTTDKKKSSKKKSSKKKALSSKKSKKSCCWAP